MPLSIWWIHLSRSRAVAPFVLLHALGVARAAAQGVAATPTSWLQYRGSTDNAGAVPGTLRANWVIRAPNPIRGIAVANGVVVVGTESRNAEHALDMSSRASFVAGVSDHADSAGTIIAVDAASGRVLWLHELPSWMHGDPVLFDGHAYASLGRLPQDAPGGVHSFDLKTGRAGWVYRTPGAVMPGGVVDSARGTIIIASFDGAAHVLDATDGHLSGASGLFGGVEMSSPHIDSEGVIYVGSGQSALVAFDTRTVSVRWLSRLAALLELDDVTTALSADAVFVTGLSAVGIRTAARSESLSEFIHLVKSAWSSQNFSEHAQWFRQQWLVAADKRTGKPLWRRPLGVGIEVPRNNSGTPVLAGSLVVVGSPVSRTLSAFDARTGQPRWRVKLTAVSKGPVTVLGDRIVFGDASAHLRAFALATGASLGSCRLSAPVPGITQPIVVGSTILVPTADGFLRAGPVDEVVKRLSGPGLSPCFDAIATTVPTAAIARPAGPH